MALTEYQRKRHFSRTPEPAAKVVQQSRWSFVVQKHDASRLHYDFRLELDGVLKSWAVPKGPSLDPAVKRLAVQVEDHPVAYGKFEGVIPEGEYGGGAVLQWDRGTWEPAGDPREGFRAGKLKFTLRGRKLRGGWTLVRTRRGNSTDAAPQWLLIKENDEAALPSDAGDVLQDEPLSVASGRDLDQIAQAKDRKWSSRKASHSKRTAARKVSASRKRRRQTTNSAGVKRPMPKSIDVQLATLTDVPPPGDQWLHEFKFDGYRMICRIDGDNVQLNSRNHQDWTSRIMPIADAVRKLPVRQALLDGEVVVLQPDGTTDFQSLQNAFRDKTTGSLSYYVFDLLYLDGRSLAELPLETRKTMLEQLLADHPAQDVLRYTEHVRGGGGDFLKQVCRLKLEGMISKRADQPYKSGRGYDWLKVKCLQEDEFVIGGYTEPSGSWVGLGALLVGFHDKQGNLHYAGKVGTGYNARTLRSLTARLKPLEQPQSPFIDLTRRIGPVHTAHWVEPSLVGQFRYGSRTREGRLRHASFQGLREDKPAEEVQMDRPQPVAKAVQKSKRESLRTANGRSQRAIQAKSPSARASADGAEIFAGVRLTHPEKLLYPEDGVTKLDLARYYESITDWILPHLAHRPAVLVRCPDGHHKPCFFQKHPGAGTPSTLRQIPVREILKTETYLVIDDVAGLISLAQIGALEVHAWGSREDRLDRPDRLIFDLDPAPDVPWPRVVDSAKQIREFLEELGLTSFVKTTGGRGLHVVVPIDRRHDWDVAKTFSKQVAEAIVSAAPDHYTANLSKAARGGKIFIDYLRNGRGATAIVPYSTRAKPGATVSTPLAWDELTPRLKSDHYHIRNLPARLSALKCDPWEGIQSQRQSLARAIRNLRSLSQFS